MHLLIISFRYDHLEAIIQLLSATIGLKYDAGTKPIFGFSSHMDMDRLRFWLAGPFTALFLILTLCVLLKPQSSGMSLPVLQLRTKLPADCGDDDPVFVRLLSDGRTVINSQPIESIEMRSRIGWIMEHRAERVVYLVPDSQISVDRFEQTLAELNASTDHLYIALLSGKLRQASECDLIWPANAFQ